MLADVLVFVKARKGVHSQNHRIEDPWDLIVLQQTESPQALV